MESRDLESDASVLVPQPRPPVGGQAARRGDVVRVPVSSLRAGQTPRTSGTNPDHVRALAAVWTQLPPVTVARETLEIIDGHHRVEAARLAGETEVPVVFFDGTQESAFVEAVSANVRHGLPLSIGERKIAARQILQIHSEWSDRRIASVSGLARSTVATLREGATGSIGQSNTRVGRDGRRRPIDIEPGRQRVTELLREQPQRPLRQLANEAGVSVGTARDVRNAYRNEFTGPQSGTTAQAAAQTPRRRPRRSPLQAKAGVSEEEILSALAHDPALIQRESGRQVLRRLQVNVSSTEQAERFVNAVPPHLTEVVATLADRYARMWTAIANKLMSQACVAPEEGLTRD